MSFPLNRLTVDVVMQATGMHAHGVGEGVATTLERIGLLGRIFRPVAPWGSQEPEYDDGLYDYLGLPHCHIMLFLGFDWHSQCLHTTASWRFRIKSSPVIKIAYCHETLTNGMVDEQEEKIAVFKRAVSVVDAVWHSGFSEHQRIIDILDNKLSVIYTPFGVDTGFFSCQTEQNERRKKPFFRGKTTAFTERNEYQERRNYLKALVEKNLVEVKSYEPEAFDDTRLADEYNQYKYCIDLPSVFAGPTTRVYEALVSGCIVYSHRRNFSKQEIDFFKNHLRTFGNIEELVVGIDRVMGSNEDNLVPHSEWVEQIHSFRSRTSLDTILNSVIEAVVAGAPGMYLAAPEVTLIDHSYHLKTNSQSFLLDTITEKCNTRTLYDAMESDKVIAYLPRRANGINVIWQCCHSNIVHELCDRGEKNIIFPMFDSSNHRPESGFPKNAKYYCFSRTLHEKLVEYDLDSNLCSYFPQPCEHQYLSYVRYRKERRKSARRDVAAYLWYRIEPVNLDLISSFFEPLNISKLYVNLSPDPGVEIIRSEWPETIKGVPVEYISWMKSKQELMNLLSECLVYFAPRVCEGIGLSFLEAMAQGMCVVAPDYPTMNEYITHGHNGILYNIAEPAEVPDVDALYLAENAYHSIEQGRAEWLTQERKIYDYIDPFRSEPCLRFLAEELGVKFFKSYNLNGRIMPIKMGSRVK